MVIFFLSASTMAVIQSCVKTAIVSPKLVLSPTPTPSVTSTTSPTAAATLPWTDTPTPVSVPTLGTVTVTVTPSPTFTPSSFNSPTPCLTVTSTYTSCPTTTPIYKISGTVVYSGVGSVDYSHAILVRNGSYPSVRMGVSSGTYTVGAYGPGTYRLVAYYDLNGLNDFIPPPTYFIPLPGMRYAAAGSCSMPVSADSWPVTVTGPTTAGPSITFDDSCSYWGVYGTVDYTGSRGSVQSCRRIVLQAYSDAAYSSPLSTNCCTVGNSDFPNLQYENSASRVNRNGNYYYFLTNTASAPIGLAPFYLLAYFDSNGDQVFDTGDPYVQLGQVTPNSDGFQLNVTFGDAFIK
ncbi:MAG TPA: hypothetical protein VHE12_02705 [bacterium]|nr:hypothetical protein [bacterium]